MDYCVWDIKFKFKGNFCFYQVNLNNFISLGFQIMCWVNQVDSKEIYEIFCMQGMSRKCLLWTFQWAERCDYRLRVSETQATLGWIPLFFVTGARNQPLHFFGFQLLHASDNPYFVRINEITYVKHPVLDPFQFCSEINVCVFFFSKSSWVRGKLVGANWCPTQDTRNHSLMLSMHVCVQDGASPTTVGGSVIPAVQGPQPPTLVHCGSQTWYQARWLADPFGHGPALLSESWGNKTGSAQ